MLCLNFHPMAQLNGPSVNAEIFTIVLHNITGDTYHSTATAIHVPITYNGTTVECRGQNIVNKQQRSASIVIGAHTEAVRGYLNCYHYCS